MSTFFMEIFSFQIYGEQSQISSLKSNDNNARSSFTQSLAYDPDRIAMTPYGRPLDYLNTGHLPSRPTPFPSSIFTGIR